MTTTAIIITLVIIITVAVALIFISQAREKAYIERMRRIKAVEDRRYLMQNILDELPPAYLAPGLRKLVRHHLLDLAHQLKALGANDNVDQMIAADEQALSQAETSNGSGSNGVTIESAEQAAEVKHLLKTLFTFVEGQHKQGRLPTPEAKKYAADIRFLVHRTQADVLVARAQEAYRNKHYRKAIHGYHLAITEMDKCKQHPKARKALDIYRERIKMLTDLAEGGEESRNRHHEKSMDQAWDQFLEEEENWKKKADYDD